VTVLVTGGAGFVGLNILEAMAARGRRVVSFDRRPVPASVSALFRSGDLVEVEGDVGNAALLRQTMAENGVTSVIHAAAITAGVDRERQAATEVVSVNLVGLTTCLEAAQATGVGRFVFASSVSVFGPGVADGALIDEDQSLAPSTLYAITKASGEAIVRRFAQVSGLPCIIGRLGVVFGRHEADTGVRDTMSPFFHAVHRASRGKSLILPRPARRNWQYGAHAGEALATLAIAESPQYQVYNLGPEPVFTVLQWCKRLKARYPAFDVAVDPTAPGAPIGLHNPSDGGLLSWQRYQAEFGPAGNWDLDRAFDDYMAFLDR
jgi:nucleoside-diphosphate-sugar epimerase